MTPPVKQLKLSDDDDEDNNPLFINSVLEALFSFLEVGDLKQCRLVCNLWKIEAFRTLRKRACVNLTTSLRQQMFLKSEIAHKFKNFSFNVSKWNEAIAVYFSANHPNSLDVDVDLVLNDDNNDGLKRFVHLVLSQADSLVRLNVNVDCTRHGTEELDMCTHLKTMKMAKLKELVIDGRRGMVDEATWLQALWLCICKNSPVLEKLYLRNFASDELLNGITGASNFSNVTELGYVHDRKRAVLGMHQQIMLNPLPLTTLKRLCIPFQDADTSLITGILYKVAATLQILEFYTQDETPLSPIVFPVMHNLTTLDAGSSQFSFPTVVPALFPKLTEIRATYWDWVYSREDLPDVHYYWRTDDPHSGIINIHLRFPNWEALDFQYRKLENFNDFSEILHSKFPAACHFNFHNVSLCNDVRQGLEKFAEVYEFAYKSFTIASYSTEIHDASPFEIVATEGPQLSRELEVVDLCSKDWPEVWSKQPLLLSTIRDEWLPVLLQFDKLRVLKLLWTKHLFSRLNLTDQNALPNLVHLEFVGNLCINRFQRAAVRRSRPELKMVQHKCLCDDEDWWYINDTNSGKIFQNLFSLGSRGVKSFFKKILFHNLLG